MMKLTIESSMLLECRKVCIIETRRLVQETIKENKGDIRLGQNPDLCRDYIMSANMI